MYFIRISLLVPALLINRRLKFLMLLLILALGLLSLSPQFVHSQSVSSLAARVSRLETENFQLRSRLNRLESQLGQVNRFPPSSPSLNLPENPPAVTDPMFDRLATLVIELKERVQSLEAEVAQLKE
jgi:outer membrane murein-binding lipoprotein Lpp